MELLFNDYHLIFQNGGLKVQKGEAVLYENPLPLKLYIKADTTAAQAFQSAYTAVIKCAEGIRACGITETSSGSRVSFTDTYSVTEEGIALDRKTEVLAQGSDLGFASAFSLAQTVSENIEDFNYFSPSFWYNHNEFAPAYVMGKDMDCEYYWYFETHCGLPVFSMFHNATGETISISRLRSDVTMRTENVVFSENSIDPKLTIGSLGMHKAKDHTLNYAYYGAALTHEFSQQKGLFVDYLYPASEGEKPMMNFYGGLDFKNKAKSFQRTYHPMEKGFTQNYGVLLHFANCENIQQVIRMSWRNNYTRLKDKLFTVDNDAFFHDSVEILNRFTKQYGNSWGLPFAAQLPNMDVNCVAFQFGFVGQQPGIGYELLRLGDMENKPEMFEKGMNVIEFWVRAADTELGLPPSCYNPAQETFEPYPYYMRMIADGVEAIQQAYKYMLKKGVKKDNWLAFLKKTADRLVKIQGEDGSFFRAYHQDGSVRMDSKSNTPSVIRFLIEMYLLTGEEAYKTTAIKAGEWTYDNAYLKLEYRGGTCDNLDIQDKEAGIYAMWGFMALYDLTKEEKWLEAAKGAADYTETWTYVWNFPISVPWPMHPFQKYGISGQSVITVGGGADVYMAACVYCYYRMYLLTGDDHYRDFAEFLNKNTRQATDADGSIGYCMKALGHESGTFYTQYMMSHYHWLPWCTFVAVEPVARLYDTFGVYEIDEAEKLPLEERLRRNDLYANFLKAPLE